MNSNDSMGTYGAGATPREVRRFLRHHLDRTFSGTSGMRGIPVCIWGLHGIGKTELVEAMASDMNAELAYLAPAQFEEMGDLLGMPQITEEGQTGFAAPSWVPQSEGPGILLIDDVNRADDRILRGIMQLLQRYELMSWSLPQKWQIVLTANPENGDYSVTPLDDSFVTRMHHIEMRWDLSSWVDWAEKSGLEERAIQFVMAYPDILDGRRTTPRTLVQLFYQLQGIHDWKKQATLLRLLGEGAVSREATLALIQYARQEMGEVILPKAMATSDSIDEIGNALRQKTEGPPRQLELLSTHLDRLQRWVLNPAHPLDNQVRVNLIYWLTQSWIPSDLRFGLARRLSESQRKGLQEVLATPEVARLLLG